jgi:uncharacterized damage-inducible protein DinB
MPPANDSTRTELEEKLRKVDYHLRREMRARGFDPDQDDNVALTAPLAKLYTERENLRSELASLMEEDATATESRVIMREVERINEQLKRAFEGGAWHGPAVMEILQTVTPVQAAARPSPGVHSIWEIALHIAAWKRAGVMRLQGQPAQLPTEEDWPPVKETSEPAWEQTIQKIKEGHDQLVRAITSLDDSRLDIPIVEGSASVYATLHGIIQHDLYHAGQIAILKKLVTEGKQV